MLKILTVILIIYLLNRYVFNPPKRVPPPQEPDIFIEYEEVKTKDEKNK
jgi:hypothetical protein